MPRKNKINKNGLKFCSTFLKSGKSGEKVEILSYNIL